MANSIVNRRELSHEWQEHVIEPITEQRLPILFIVKFNYTRKGRMYKG